MQLSSMAFKELAKALEDDRSTVWENWIIFVVVAAMSVSQSVIAAEVVALLLRRDCMANESS